MYALLADTSVIVEVITPVACVTLAPLIIIIINSINEQFVEGQNKKIDPSAFTVKFNALAIGAMIFLTVLLIITTLVFPITYLCNVPDRPPLDITIIVACCFGAAATVSGVFLVGMKRRKIYVSEAGIKFVPMFGKRQEYGWKDISYVHCVVGYGDISNYNVYVKPDNKKAFFVNRVMVGGELFLDKLREHGFMF